MLWNALSLLLIIVFVLKATLTDINMNCLAFFKFFYIILIWTLSNTKLNEFCSEHSHYYFTVLVLSHCYPSINPSFFWCNLIFDAFQSQLQTAELIPLNTTAYLSLARLQSVYRFSFYVKSTCNEIHKSYMCICWVLTNAYF